jgi:hypothetical protein
MDLYRETNVILEVRKRGLRRLGREERMQEEINVRKADLMYIGPCVVVIVNEMKNQLDAT